MGNKKTAGLPVTSLTTTRWSEAARAGETWKEYPRPSMVRDSWINLNGSWDYAIRSIRDGYKIPAEYDGRILVPFSPESVLSGVHRQLQPDEFLWYHRKVTVPRLPEGQHYLLHFGAVDQSCVVFIDGDSVGTHTGGYLPFTIDLKDTLESKMECLQDGVSRIRKEYTFDLSVRVRDLSDTSYHARGKQKLQRGGMYYTAQSGIWQTVWMEAVPEHYITALRITPDIDHSCCLLEVITDITAPEYNAYKRKDTSARTHKPKKQRHFIKGITCSVNGQGRWVSAGTTIKIPVKHMHLWSPEDPYLYSLHITMENDAVDSYFAMRNFEIRHTEENHPCFFLNGEPCPQTGVLDQGYWCDGLMTAPSDEALIYDIQTMKDLGFNMIRKHIKIEPERWYYHCDRLGMLVWQDMVNGGTPYQDWLVTYLATAMNVIRFPLWDGFLSRLLLSRMSREGREEFLGEMEQTVDLLYSHPCIIVWVPFNEGWGQFNAAKAAAMIKEKDPTRFVDHASGWFDQHAGDILSIHHYFFRLHYLPEKKRVLALTEFGGYTWVIQDHSFGEELYGYGGYASREELTEAMDALYEQEAGTGLPKGMYGYVYTQLSDIEDEANGLLTYDREVLKPDPEMLRKWNKKIRNYCQKTRPQISVHKKTAE